MSVNKRKSMQERQDIMINVNDFVNNQINVNDISAIPNQIKDQEEEESQLNLTRSLKELKFLRSTTSIMNKAKVKEYIKNMSPSLNPSCQKRPYI